MSKGNPSGSGWSLVQRLLLISTLLYMLSPVTISVSNEDTVFSVLNRTGHYVHVIINSSSFLYIAPQNIATYRTEGPANVLVRVFYAPGQGIEGDATRTFFLQAYNPGGTSCSQTRSGGCECTTEPTTYGSYQWVVTPDTLQTTELMQQRGRLSP